MGYSVKLTLDVDAETYAVVQHIINRINAEDPVSIKSANVKWYITYPIIRSIDEN